MTGFGEFDTSCPGHPCHDWHGEDDKRACRNCGQLACEHMDSATAARTAFFNTRPLAASPLDLFSAPPPTRLFIP